MLLQRGGHRDEPSTLILEGACRAGEFDALAITGTFVDQENACPSGGSGCGCDYTGWRPGGG